MGFKRKELTASMVWFLIIIVSVWKNPDIPSVMTDNPPALEGSAVSSSFAQHINTLHAARRSYIEAKSSEHIRKALQYKMRTFATVSESGCRVYYKRDNSNKWKGPGIVIGSYFNTSWKCLC